MSKTEMGVLRGLVKPKRLAAIRAVKVIENGKLTKLHGGIDQALSDIANAAAEIAVAQMKVKRHVIYRTQRPKSHRAEEAANLWMPDEGKQVEHEAFGMLNSDENLEARRQALADTAGMWKDRDIDGLEYQLAERAEW